MMRITKKHLLATGAVAFALAMGGTAMADEAAPAAPQPGDHFEIHDNADTAPVNYRSNEDKRYDTEKQHDAEMYAEQYEQQRQDDQLQQQKMLDRMNRLSPSSNNAITGAGVTADGFPSNRPY